MLLFVVIAFVVIALAVILLASVAGTRKQKKESEKIDDLPVWLSTLMILSSKSCCFMKTLNID